MLFENREKTPALAHADLLVDIPPLKEGHISILHTWWPRPESEWARWPLFKCYWKAHQSRMECMSFKNRAADIFRNAHHDGGPVTILFFPFNLFWSPVTRFGHTPRSNNIKPKSAYTNGLPPSACYTFKSCRTPKSNEAVVHILWQL